MDLFILFHPPVFVAMIVTMAANAYWYYAKWFVRSQGVSFSWFDHMGDFTRLGELARTAPDREVQEKAAAICGRLKLAIGAFVLVAAPLFFWGVNTQLRPAP